MILWNGQYVYGFLINFSTELIEEHDYKYIIQPSVYASLPQIKNVVTNGYDDGISEQLTNNIKKWSIEFSEMEIPDIKINININIDFTDFNKSMKELEQTTKKLQAIM